ncbi:MAG: tetratricopeptide repeat protein [Kaiparowitsia implicata GSE-PSE-MK54-09C]|nr:tetratricopeptide repeat protein [Kaiparowitsia implicata GSE-PSE-MK54-09C]
MVVGIGGFGLGVMLWAYQGAGSRTIVFREPISMPPVLVDSEELQFARLGCEAFREGQFERAIAHFTQALQQDTTLAEARHNLGLVQANLKRDNDAVRSLVQAGEVYLEQGNRQGYERVKADLATLKTQRLGQDPAGAAVPPAAAPAAVDESQTEEKQNP